MRLQSALSGLNPAHRMTPDLVPLGLTEENCKTLKNLYLNTDWGQLDCLSEVLGIGDFKEVQKASETIPLGNKHCQILRIEPLIVAKQAMGRPKDIETIRQLKLIQIDQSK